MEWVFNIHSIFQKKKLFMQIVRFTLINETLFGLLVEPLEYNWQKNMDGVIFVDGVLTNIRKYELRDDNKIFLFI